MLSPGAGGLLEKRGPNSNQWGEALKFAEELRAWAGGDNGALSLTLRLPAAGSPTGPPISREKVKSGLSVL